MCNVPLPGRPQGSPLPTYHVILSAAKDLCARRVRPFAALRVTIDGMPPGADETDSSPSLRSGLRLMRLG